MRWLAALTIGLALAACTTAPRNPPPAYVVFFPNNSIVIPADGASIIASAAADARAHGDKMVEVAGPSTKIAPGYNPGLAAPRISAVEHALMVAGVDPKRLARTSLTTGDVKAGNTGAQRVEIRLVDKPSS